MKKLFRAGIIAAALLFGFFAANQTVRAAYPALPTFSYGCMAMTQWQVYNDQNQAIYNSSVSNCTSRSTVPTPIQIEAGKTYRFELYGFLYMGTSCCYSPILWIWMDWNGNQNFTDLGEKIYQGQAPSYYTAQWFVGYFTVPTSAQGNTVRMRFAARWTAYGNPDYTGTLTGYGDAADIDFFVPKPPSDAGATSISQPSGAFTKGTQNIAVKITNYEPKALTACHIVWRIDEGQGTESSNTFMWTGSLAQNDTAEVVVGTYDFNESRQYTIDAFTEAPNNDIDVNPANDRALRRVVAPAIAPGDYYIGHFSGSSNTFSTISAATSYLSQAGIIGNGTVSFIFPDQDFGDLPYPGPITIGSFPSSGTNNFVIRSQSNDPSKVTIEYAPSAGTRYLMTLNAADNAVISGITFHTLNTNGYGGIIDLEGCNNVTISHNVFNNVVGASKNTNYVTVNSVSSYDVKIDTCTFNDGAIGINENSFCPRKVAVTGNTFNNITWINAQFYGNPDGNMCNENNISIMNNQFNSSGAQSGILSTNGTEISGNIFSGFTGLSANDAVIYLNNTDPTHFTTQSLVQSNQMIGGLSDVNGISTNNVPNVIIDNNQVNITDNMFNAWSTDAVKVIGSGNSTTPAFITNNTLSYNNSANGNTIYLDGSYVKVNKNKATISGGGGSVYGLYANNTNGYIANNQIGGTNTYAMSLNTCGLGVYYNSMANQSATLPTLNINGGSNKIMRNIVQNMGTGPAIVASNAGGNTLNQNNYHTTGATLGRWGGTATSDLASWQATSGQDANSTNLNIQFIDFNTFDLGLNLFDEALVFDTPLTFADPSWDAEFQTVDFVGNTRYSYFMGSENIVPEVFITVQPSGVMDCLGTMGQALSVSAYVTKGVQARFEWYKDGVSLTNYYKSSGEDWANKASLYLDSMNFIPKAGLGYEMEGTYRCLVRGSGAEPKWSDYILVNVLSPAQITRQPEDKRVNLGDNLLLKVEAHIVADSGKSDPFYQPDIQWYKGNTPLTDDYSIGGHYNGVKSNILTIRNVSSSELTTNGSYWVKLQGACNTISSDSVSVKLYPNVIINGEPDPVNVCEGASALFQVTANPSETGATLEYMWRKDGVAIPGQTENKLTVDPVTTADAGQYDCVVTVLPGGKTATTQPASLTVKLKPTIINQSTDQTPVAGNSLYLFVNASGEPPLMYQWYKDGSPLTGETSSSYTVASATFSDAGDYVCKVTNECDSVTTNPIQVTVTTGGVLGVNDTQNGGFALNANQPNPFTGTTTIEYFVPQTSHVRLTVTDVYGQEVALLVDKVLGKGLQNVSFSASEHKLASGVYYYTMTSGNYTLTRKMVVVK